VKAVVIHAPGAPEQLVMADVPEPDPGPGEVLVDVAFAGCNWADTQIRTGIYPHARTYPLVLGLEIAGTVSKLGPGVTGVRIGERVAARLHPAWSDRGLAESAHRRQFPYGRGGGNAPLPRIPPSRRQARSGDQSMIRKSGNRFSEKIMLYQNDSTNLPAAVC
jgi:NADPH:quinone reductase-like Zn-dependent oxidoreductase